MNKYPMTLLKGPAGRGITNRQRFVPDNMGVFRDVCASSVRATPPDKTLVLQLNVLCWRHTCEATPPPKTPSRSGGLPFRMLCCISTNFASGIYFVCQSRDIEGLVCFVTVTFVDGYPKPPGRGMVLANKMQRISRWMMLERFGCWLCFSRVVPAHVILAGHHVQFLFSAQ